MTSIKSDLFKSTSSDDVKYKDAFLFVAKNGNYLRFIPDSLKTLELCLSAVMQDGYSLYYVPDSFKTPELCMVAVQQNAWSLEYVPDTLKTIELCMVAVRTIGLSFQYVHESLKTPELCLTAVRKNGGAIDYMPSYLNLFVNKFKDQDTSGWTPEVYALEALKCDPTYLPLVAPDMLSSESFKALIMERFNEITDGTLVKFMGNLIHMMDASPMSYERQN